MKIAVSRYILRPLRELNARVPQTPREGALLRVELTEGFGYADCHPWPEFGDLTLDAQLDALKAGQLTSLLKRSLHFAELDAKARAAKTSLLAHATVPLSHANLATPEVTRPMLATLSDQGFKTIKLKFGPLHMNSWSTVEYLMRTHPQFQWRLDLNASFNGKTAFAFLSSIAADTLQKIEFIEDPSSFNVAEWTKMQTRLNLSLAADFECDETAAGAAFKVRVMKPALQDLNVVAGVEAVVVTSYMDHPLGQVAAAWSAAQVATQEPDKIRACGLQSHTVYEKTAFSDQLAWETPHWRSPEGTGFGFDDLLAEQTWTTL